MKAYTMFAAGLFLASVSALGQSGRQAMPQDRPYFAVISSHSEEYMQKAANTYTQLLNSANDGVVESAIAHLTFMRLGLPKMDLRDARSTIANLTESGRTPVIRYKAHLATIVFESPELFMNGIKAESTESDLFFRDIASKAQKTLLGQNTGK